MYLDVKCLLQTLGFLLSTFFKTEKLSRKVSESLWSVWLGVGSSKPWNRFPSLPSTFFCSFISADNAHMFSLVPRLRHGHMSWLPQQSSTVFGNVCSFLRGHRGKGVSLLCSVWSSRSAFTLSPNLYSFLV